MNRIQLMNKARPLALAAGLWLLLLGQAAGMHGNAVIEGISGPDFTLTAKSGYIRTPDGNSILIWGFANGTGTVQYPGPTLIVTEGSTVTIRLTSQISQPVSLVVPGFDITASGGQPGLLTREAPPNGTTVVTYTFLADRPGTFVYYSGTRPDLQVEMGLVGALIVRPTGYVASNPATWTAYGDARSAYDHEYLFLLTEMDERIHELVDQGRIPEVNTADYFPVYWFINGRNAPDTMLEAHSPLLPTQPYNSMPMMNAGQRLLMRLIGAGRDAHPFHAHGNNFDLIARDALLMERTPGGSRSAEVGTIPDLSVSDFTQAVYPGSTYDAIFTWTGKGLGWDMYGHDGTEMDICNEAITDRVVNGFDTVTHEDCSDHGKPFPVVLPGLQELTFGAFYSGSPFLGAAGSLPPGEGGNNPNSGFVYMWHSHNEKEMTNNDIFPGGLMTMLIIEAPSMTPMP